ncbi:DNA-directed RNA polymerase III subunit RPC7-like [Styela clava]
MSKGRGRGRGSGLSFNIEAIGFGRGDALPTSLLQPPPDYPPLKKRPVPLLTGEDQDYLLALQKNFEKTMRDSPYYIKKQEEKNFLDRYSDKYRISNHSDNELGWEPDWSRFPAELKIEMKRKRKASKKIAPKLVEKKKAESVNEEEVKKKLDELEKKDQNPEAQKAGDANDTESEVELEIDEVDEDEGNDYLTSYFDNGESYLDEEEDTLDDKDGGIY